MNRRSGNREHDRGARVAGAARLDEDLSKQASTGARESMPKATVSPAAGSRAGIDRPMELSVPRQALVHAFQSLTFILIIGLAVLDGNPALPQEQTILFAVRLDPQTLRQLHYAIFSRRDIAYENSQAAYKRLSRTTTLARRLSRSWELNGRRGLEPELGIPAQWMVDETREGCMVSVRDDTEQYIETVKRCYRRDNRQDPTQHCEVWSEKATILGAIRPVLDQWGAMVRVCHGFRSPGMEGEVGRLFECIGDTAITVLYLGDHDPSGHVIGRDIHRRVVEARGIQLKIQRLAIHAAYIHKFHLPPQRIKLSDSRASSFRNKFGPDDPTVELDALPAAELRKRVEETISSLVEPERSGRQIASQEAELNCIADFADRIKALPQLQPQAEGEAC